MTTNRVTITGDVARELRTIAVTVKSGAGWAEVHLSDCTYGCKIHARRQGAVTRFAIMHSATYGCPLGRDEATATQPVSVRISRAVAAATAELKADFATTHKQISRRRPTLAPAA